MNLPPVKVVIIILLALLFICISFTNFCLVTCISVVSGSLFRTSSPAPVLYNGWRKRKNLFMDCPP
ncbi:MAG: hypothetical protein AYK18_09655 [Theionarchaea archaeon DG-70]|nr:MAG: hypothetical protein AYK18_09655 [Theionarchaea archaeon DG-70]